MPISIDSSSSASSVQSAAPQFGPDVKLLNANDILAYVTLALSNMGDQLNDYKDVVMKQQSDAKEIREALVGARQLNANGGSFEKDVDFPSQEQNYNETMTKLSHHLDDPNVKKAYDSMISSFGSYKDTNSGKTIGAKDAEVEGKILVPALVKDISTSTDDMNKKTLDGSKLSTQMVEVALDPGGQDHKMSKDEMDGFVNSLNDALTGINSGNELLMMNLQNLMQNRNEITQFSSNVMKTLHDTESTPINNIKS